MSGPDKSQPVWCVPDANAFLAVVRASGKPVRAVRSRHTAWDPEVGRSVPMMRVDYAIYAEHDDVRCSEVLDVEETTGRITAAPGSLWRVLRHEAGIRLWVDGATPRGGGVLRFV